VSITRGESWAKLNGNLPTVAVLEVAQPTTASEIAIATHGRGIWILDVASVRQLTPEVLSAPATLFAPAAVTRWQFGPGSFPYSRDVRKFYGTNPPAGGSIDYMLTKAAKEVSVRVLDVNGKAAREFRQPGSGVDGAEFAQMITVENDPNAASNAVITDGPELPGEGNEPQAERRQYREGEVPDVTPFIPRAED
jgi:hypothetical protein